MRSGPFAGPTVAGSPRVVGSWVTGRYDRFKTHRRSRRLAGYDYTSAGWYFVTICTDGRRCLFGEVRGGVMGLNVEGCLAHACWEAIPDHVSPG